METGALTTAQGRRDAVTHGRGTATRFWGRRAPNAKGSKSNKARASERESDETAPSAQNRGHTLRPHAGVEALSMAAGLQAASRAATAVRLTVESSRSTSSGLSKKPSAPRRMQSLRISTEGSELATKTLEPGRWLLT